MESESFCVFVFTPTSDGAYSRMFAPEYGIPEDPATGSSTGPLAVFMMRRGLVSNAAGTRFKRTGNEDGPSQPPACRYPGRKWHGRNLHRRSGHADYRRRNDIERRLRHGSEPSILEP
jgi:hypothetical protein